MSHSSPNSSFAFERHDACSLFENSNENTNLFGPPPLQLPPQVNMDNSSQNVTCHQPLQNQPLIDWSKDEILAFATQSRSPSAQTEESPKVQDMNKMCYYGKPCSAGNKSIMAHQLWWLECLRMVHDKTKEMRKEADHYLERVSIEETMLDQIHALFDTTPSPEQYERHRHEYTQVYAKYLRCLAKLEILQQVSIVVTEEVVSFNNIAPKRMRTNDMMVARMTLFKAEDDSNDKQLYELDKPTEKEMTDELDTSKDDKVRCWSEIYEAGQQGLPSNCKQFWRLLNPSELPQWIDALQRIAQVDEDTAFDERAEILVAGYEDYDSEDEEEEEDSYDDEDYAEPCARSTRAKVPQQAKPTDYQLVCEIHGEHFTDNRFWIAYRALDRLTQKRDRNVWNRLQEQARLRPPLPPQGCPLYPSYIKKFGTGPADWCK